MMIEYAPGCPLHGWESTTRELVCIDDYLRPMLRELLLGILRK